MEQNDEVQELSSGAEHLNENAALEEIKKILEHPGLRNRERLKRRLWLYLQTQVSHKF